MLLGNMYFHSTITIFWCCHCKRLICAPKVVTTGDYNIRIIVTFLQVKELEARSTCSSRPTTPSHHASQQSLNSDDQPFSPGASRHKSFVLSPTSARRVELPAEPKTGYDIGKRYALGSDNLDSRNSSNVGKRYASRSDTLDFGTSRSNRSVIGAERQNGHPRGGSRDSSHEKPDINEIFKIIDKTRLESEANNRSPTDDISGTLAAL